MPAQRALMNYSTGIDIAKTVGEIMAHLATHGAQKIMLDYGNGIPVGVMFTLILGGIERGFRLPVNIDAVYAVLQRQKQTGVIRQLITREQAGRVAWRILKDWVEAQIGIVESDMVSMGEVFLPYLITDGKQTLYEMVAGGQFLLPTGEVGRS